jgi:hypothetical protein
VLLHAFLQWAAKLLKAQVLEDVADLTAVLTDNTCISAECAAGAAKAFVTITASVVSIKVGAVEGSLHMRGSLQGMLASVCQTLPGRSCSKVTACSH